MLSYQVTRNFSLKRTRATPATLRHRILRGKAFDYWTGRGHWAMSYRCGIIRACEVIEVKTGTFHNQQ